MLLSQDPLLAFKNFGFVEGSPATGGHVRGRCPFCQKDDHFYVNVTSENKTWDCKKCGRSGGFQKFLQEVADFASGKNIPELAKDRGLSEKTLEDAGAGFINGKWILPVWDINKEKILNIKIYDGTSFKNTASCSTVMYGLWMLPNKYDDIYLAEGEWDYLALKNAGARAILAVPGAGIFKTENIPLFLGKRVYMLYDNDESGRHGRDRALNLLSPVATDIYTIEWPAGTIEGYDIRDVFKRKGAETLKYINSICKLHAISKGGASAFSPDMPPPKSIDESYKVFHKWLLMKDNELLDVIFGTVLANRLQGDPVWMFIVAPPGGTKSAPLMRLAGCAGIETLSSLTPATLISGHSLGGSDPSLIPLLDQKTLVIKDFTVIMGLPAAERDEIQSILRDAYDGECKRVFANGVTRSYKSKFGIIAGVTPAIETFADENTRLGERFLRWRNWLPVDWTTRKKYIERAMANTAFDDQMHMELSGAAKRILLADYTNRIPVLDKRISNIIVCISDWISTMRGTILRDKFRHNALYKPAPELGTRICKELTKLFTGVAMLHGKIDNSCFAVIKNVAKSSVNTRYLDIMKFMFSKGIDRPYSTKELQSAIGLAMDTVSIVLDDLLLLKVLSKTADGQTWKLNKDFLRLTTETELFK
jgi:hypothetical protein